MGFPFEFRFAPIMRRNTPLPASRSEVFHTYRDRQTEVEIDVYQGENDDVRRNHAGGQVHDSRAWRRCAAGNPIVVQLDLNLDGMLKVSARERATGLQKQVVIENALAQFEREERDEARDRLDRLWVDQGEATIEDVDEETEEATRSRRKGEVPSLAPGPREGQREAVQARALLEKAERLMERVQPEDKPEVERLMEKVRTALTDRQWDQLTAASNELADVLFYLEDA